MFGSCIADLNFLQAMRCRLAVCACLCLSPGIHAQEVSRAETLLFQTHHLQNIPEATTLIYTYSRKASEEPGFEDQVVMKTGTGAGNGIAVTMQFLSGSRELRMQDVGNAKGNPVLLGFLERDVLEMKMRTGGSANYFRKRIRLALAEAATVLPVAFRYENRTINGQEIRISPYLKDPLRKRFEKYAHKTYVFVLSSELPGGIYQLRSSLSEEDQQDREERPAGRTSTKEGIRLEETLTLVQVRKGDTVHEKRSSSNPRSAPADVFAASLERNASLVHRQPETSIELGARFKAPLSGKPGQLAASAR